MRRPGSILWVAMLLASSCGGDDDVSPQVNLEPSSVIVENRTDFELTEIRFHTEPDYRAPAARRIERLLVSTATMTVHAVGSWFVTAYREKNTRGPLRAYSTEVPLEIDAGQGYRLEIFNESFRLTPEGPRRPWASGDVRLSPEPETTTSSVADAL